MDVFVTRGACVRYGITFGMFAGSLCAVPDVLVTAGWGYRMPVVVPAMSLAVYLVCGAFGGGLLGALCRTRTRPVENRRHTNEDAYARIRAACRIACVAGLAAVFFERMRLGYEGYFEQETGVVPAAVAISAGMLSVMRLRVVVAGPSEAMAGWQMLCAAGFCALWQPYSSLYQAPTFSKVSIIANVAYLAGWAFVYFAFPLAGSHFLRRAERRLALGVWSRTVVTVVAGFVVAIGVLRYRAGSPIDIADAGRTHGLQSVGFDAGSGVIGERPNVVLIVIDTARADHMSVYGYPADTTPRLKMFAEEAVRFDMAVAPSSWTLPSHASLFTGLLPTEHRAHNIRCGAGWTIRPLADSFLTMAEVLSSAGYRTGAVVANTACLSREFGVQQGFDYYDDSAKPTVAAAKVRNMSPSGVLLRLYQHSLEGWRTDWSRNAAEINADALAWLDRAEDGPFFLFLNYLDPHAPYHQHTVFSDAVPAEPRTPPEVRRYDQEIAFTDAHIGILFDELRSRGVYDNSLIVVTSDHGEAFGEHGTHGHGHTLYQEEIHVPLLVRYPHGSERGVRSDPVSLTEVPGMVFGYLDSGGKGQGERGKWKWGGDSRGARFGLVASDDRGDERVFAELREVDSPQEGCSAPVVRAILDCRGQKTIVSSRGVAELYDLDSDPDELFDLSGQRYETLERAFAGIDTWTARVEERRRATADSVVLSDALRDQLRSLGYVK